MYVDVSDVLVAVVLALILAGTAWLIGRRNRRLILAGQAAMRAELEHLRAACEERSGAWAVVNTLTSELLGERDAHVIPLSRGRRR